MARSLIGIAALALARALFTLASLSLAALSLGRLRELGEEKGEAKKLLAWRQRPQRLLVCQQAASLLFLIGAAAVAAATLGPELASWWSAGTLEEATPFFATFVALLFVLLLFLALGDLVPRALALQQAERWALRLGPLLRFCLRALLPLAALAAAFGRLILWPAGLREAPLVAGRTSPERLRRLSEEALEQGSLDPITGPIALRAFDFAETKTAEVMVPRNRVVALPLAAPAAEIQRIALEEGHARMPVYEESIDEVVGYVLGRDLHALAWEGEEVQLEELLRPAYFVPETLRAAQLLQELQARRIGIAIVVEESGGMAGIVTLEDLVEELVGELFTEGEEDVPQPIRKRPDSSANVLGITAIRDVNRELGTELPEGEAWSTVAGLCIELAGRIPEKGACLRAPDGSVLEVLEASPRRVRMVRVVPPP